MRSLVSAEMLRLRTVPLPRAVLALAVLGSAALAHVVVRIATETRQDVRLADLIAGVSQPLSFLVVVVAVVATAGEMRHRTVRLTLLAAPRRSPVLAAMAMTASAYGALIGLLGGAAALGSGALTMRAEGLPVSADGILPGLAAVVGIGACWALLGAGLGVLTRSTAVAIATVLVWQLVLEGIVPVVTRQPELGRWLPGGAADALLQEGPHYLDPWAGGLLFAGYAAAVVLLGAVSFVHRDPA